MSAEAVCPVSSGQNLPESFNEDWGKEFEEYVSCDKGSE